jgi:lysophospholipase L1-like esterase
LHQIDRPSLFYRGFYIEVFSGPGWLLLCLLMLSVVLSAKGGSLLNKIFYLGDSYLDEENYFSLNHISVRAYSPPWSTVANRALGLQSKGRWTPTGGQSPFGTNYAVAGAGINFSSLAPAYTSLHGQVARLLQDYPQGLPSQSLTVIGIGTNDVRAALGLSGISSGRRFLDQELQIFTTDIQSLARQSRLILVLSPPTDALPEYHRKPTQALARQTWKYLYERMAALAAENPERIRLFDLKPIFEAVISQPSHYGFKHNYPCWLGSASANPDLYIFWDLDHPSGGMHRYIAKRFLRFLRKTGWD